MYLFVLCYNLSFIDHGLRMGDYHRYLAKFATGDKRKDSTDKSLEAYKTASDVAVTELPPTPHPPWSCMEGSYHLWSVLLRPWTRASELLMASLAASHITWTSETRSGFTRTTKKCGEKVRALKVLCRLPARELQLKCEGEREGA